MKWLMKLKGIILSSFLGLGMTIAVMGLLATRQVVLVRAASYTVTNTDPSGAGSLRQAIIDANSNTGHDTIDFGVDGTIVLTDSLPAITDTLTISGPGAGSLAVSGANTYRPFSITTGVAVTISGLTVRDGFAVDGGGIYRPNESKAGEDEKGNYRSYQSMTYAGLLSFIYANVDKHDKRVQAAVRWIGEHWDLTGNFPIGRQGLYYNYHTMAKALNAYGEKYITDKNGVKHDWYLELAQTLMKKQDREGYWVNDEDRWFEDNKVLVTCYSILALSEGYENYR